MLALTLLAPAEPSPAPDALPSPGPVLFGAMPDPRGCALPALSRCLHVPRQKGQVHHHNAPLSNRQAQMSSDQAGRSRAHLVGILSCCPDRSVLLRLKPLARSSSVTVTPCRLAISERVSPLLTL